MYILGIIYMIVIFLMTTIVIRSRHKMIFLHMITLSLFSYKLIEYTIYGLNLELAKKPEHCLEYIIVHEMVHFLERNHTERFVAHMDKFIPLWRNHKQELNQFPLAHEDWSY